MITSVDIDFLMKYLKKVEYRGIGLRLLSNEGISKEELHCRLREISPQSSSDQIDLERMNLIGYLRTHDFGIIVEGGRKKGVPYRVIGYEARNPVETNVSWGEEEWDIYRSIMGESPNTDLKNLDGLEGWLEKAFQVTQEPVDRAFGQEWVENNPVLPSMSSIFENTYGNLAFYHLGGRTFAYTKIEGRFYPGRAVVIQKTISRPKFTILQYGLDLSMLYDLAVKLGKISYGEVTIQNVAPEELPDLKDVFKTNGTIANVQSVYDCEKVVRDPTAKLGSRSGSYIRRMDRENLWISTDSCFGLLSDVVSIWKDTLESRHRQLSFVRDYRAISLDSSRKLMLLGLRDNHPVSTVVVDVYLNRSDYAAKIVEKSLNYTSQPMGRPGTSSWTFVRTCQSLLEAGVRYYNGGRIYGGEPGLVEHKLSLADDRVTQYDFNTRLRRKEGK